VIRECDPTMQYAAVASRSGGWSVLFQSSDASVETFTLGTCVFSDIDTPTGPARWDTRLDTPEQALRLAVALFVEGCAR